MLKVKIKKLHPDAKTPAYGHKGDAGLDLYSLEDREILPGEHVWIYNGIALEFPSGYAAIVKDKSSMAKAGLHTMGGVFDSGFRGEYNVHLVNLGQNSYKIEKGDKVAQLILYPIAEVCFEESTELSDSSRSTGAFGSTGKK